MRASREARHPPHVIAAGGKGPRSRRLTTPRWPQPLPAFFDHPEALLARCRTWARTVVWVVRHTPGRAASACRLPAARMASRGREARHRHHAAWFGVRVASAHVAFADWTFTGVVPISWSCPPISPIASVGLASDDRRKRMTAHLARRRRVRDRAIASNPEKICRFLCGDNNEQAHLGHRQPDAIRLRVDAVGAGQSQQLVAIEADGPAGPPQYFLPKASSPRPAGPSRSAAWSARCRSSTRTIAKSTARSVTELLNENAVGFMSEWTPARPRSTFAVPPPKAGPRLQEPGAGADQRPSRGTANTSSCRAPTSSASRSCVDSSVIYGSQNMGGVINII